MVLKVPKVVVLVLNYAKWEETVTCIRSLQKCTYPRMEILVIDNASPNGSELQLQKKFPDLTVLQTGNNLGYTGGVNYGIKIALQRDPEYILVINPDTIVDSHFLDHLVEAMQECPSAAAACGTIHYLPERAKAWYAGGRMVPWRGLAVHNTSVPTEGEASRLVYHKVTFVTGCEVLLRVALLQKIGLQDDRFFMYLDDIEYSGRIRNKGYDLLYVPRSVIYHKVLREDTNIYKLYYSIRNRLLLINSTFSGIDNIVARFYFLVVVALKLIIWRLTRPQFYRAARMGLEDYFARNFGAGRGTSLVVQE